jgi:hypothetical protein
LRFRGVIMVQKKKTQLIALLSLVRVGPDGT